MEEKEKLAKSVEQVLDVAIVGIAVGMGSNVSVVGAAGEDCERAEDEGVWRAMSEECEVDCAGSDGRGGVEG